MFTVRSLLLEFVVRTIVAFTGAEECEKWAETLPESKLADYTARTPKEELSGEDSALRGNLLTSVVERYLERTRH